VSNAQVVSASLPRGLFDFSGADRRGRDADPDARLLWCLTMIAPHVGEQEHQLYQQQRTAATYLDAPGLTG
jgi:hypothetical protein